MADESDISSALEAINKAGFVDLEWIRKNLRAHLRRRRWQRSWWQKTFGIPPYPVSLAHKVTQILKQARQDKTLSIPAEVKRLKLETKVWAALATFFKDERLDLGFPLYEVNQHDVGKLFSAALYRFAYRPRTEQVDRDDLQESRQFEGVYLVFLQKVDTDSFERRLLIRKVADPNVSMMDVEISKNSDQWRIRCGPEAPSLDAQTAILSDRFDAYGDVVRQIVEAEYCAGTPASEQIDFGRVRQAADEVFRFKYHDLTIYTVSPLRVDKATIKGTVHSKMDVFTFVGRRVDNITTQDLNSVGPFLKNEIIGFSVQDRDLLQHMARAAIDSQAGITFQDETNERN